MGPLPQWERGTRAEPESAAIDTDELLERARQAAATGDYHLAGRLAGQIPGSVAASVLRVRALANVDTAAAAQACAEALDEHTLAGELHLLHSVLLLELGQLEPAEQAARRVLYLCPDLPLAHFTLGSIRWRRGDRSGARRCCSRARELACQRPADEPLLHGDETAGSLVAAVDAQLHLIDASGEAGP